MPMPILIKIRCVERNIIEHERETDWPTFVYFFQQVTLGSNVPWLRGTIGIESKEQLPIPIGAELTLSLEYATEEA